MKIKKNKNAIMTALAFSVAVSMNGCVFDPSDNANQNAYGPPPSGYLESAPDDESFDPSDNLAQGAYGAPIEEWEIENNNGSQNDGETQTVSENKNDTNE